MDKIEVQNDIGVARELFRSSKGSKSENKYFVNI